MPRLRGAKIQKPEGHDAWPLLNAYLFGDNAIGGHDVTVKPESLPVDWAAVFGRAAPLNLEIGFNRGRFLTSLAQRQPEENFLGVEVRRRYCYRIANSLAGADPKACNLRVIWADAKAVCTAILATGNLKNIYVNFPDPWWKRRHVKRRLVDSKFASDLAQLLEPGGKVWVKSDVPAIADEIQQALASVSSFGEFHTFDEDALPLTHREKSCIRSGLPITRYWVASHDDR